MERKYSYFFKKASNLNSFTFKKNKSSIFLRALYLLVSLVGKIFIFTRPIFAIADNNYLAMIEQTHSFSFLKIFEGTTKKEKYLHLLGFYLIVDVTFISIALPITLPCYFFLNNGHGTEVTRTVFTILDFLPYVIWAIISPNLVAVGYLGHKSSTLDISDYFFSSFKATKGFRVPLFFTGLLTLILSSLIVVLPIVLFYQFINIFTNDATMIFTTLVYILMLVIYIFLLTPLYMNFKMANYLYFSEHAIAKKTVTVKQVPGTKVKYAPLFSEDEERKENN